MPTYTIPKIEARLRQILCDELMVDDEQLTHDAKLIDDLGAEELDVVELVMVLENRFKIEIDDDQIDKFITVKDVLQYLMRRLVRS